MTDKDVLIVVDYPQKFMPIWFRESQIKYFGKKGLSWHLSVAITREDDKYAVGTYVHMLDYTPQDQMTVCSLLQDVISTIKQNKPKVTTAHIKSDNASYYHNATVIAFLSEVGKRIGLHVKRYDFSEAQSGKDICDRRTAPIKQHMLNYAHSGKDVLTGLDMFTATQSLAGIRGTSICVALPRVPETESVSIPGVLITSIYNVQYNPASMVMWRAYGIGRGKSIKKRDLKGNPPATADMDIIQPFTQMEGSGSLHKLNKRKEKAKQSDDTEAAQEETAETAGEGELFQCHICSKSYTKQRFLDKHLIIGKHLPDKSKTNAYHIMKRKWVDFCQGREIKPAQVRSQDTPGERQVRGASDRHKQKMGWALKTSRKSTRHDPKVKAFVEDLYDLGEKTKKKVTAEEAVRLIKTATDREGSRRFKKEHWLTAKQVKNLYGRITAKRAAEAVGQRNIELDDILEEDIPIDDIVADIAREAIDAMFAQ